MYAVSPTFQENHIAQLAGRCHCSMQLPLTLSLQVIVFYPIKPRLLVQPSRYYADASIRCSIISYARCLLSEAHTFLLYDRREKQQSNKNYAVCTLKSRSFCLTNQRVCVGNQPITILSNII